MTALPSPRTLSSVVEETTQAMYGFPVSFVGECEWGLPGVNETATIIVPLIGAPLYIISTRAGDAGGPALASAVYRCDSADTNPEMVEDALRELCSVVAGQLKNLVAKHHEIGLPSRLLDDRTLHDVNHWSGATVRIGTQSNAEVHIAIAEFDGFG